jgi:hypothetical protein
MSTRSEDPALSGTVRGGPRASRGLIFAGIVAVCLVAGAGYVLWNTLGHSATGTAPAAQQNAAFAAALADAGGTPLVVSQNVRRDADYVHIAV